MNSFCAPFALLLTMSSFAQQPNPWASIGKIETKKYLTLSDGKYDEFHANDRYVKVGSAIVDMKTNKIDHFVVEQPDTTEYANEADVIHRFLSIDPESKKYPDLTPYHYADNSPIWKMDKDGDSTVYYTESGSLLGYSIDDLPNALVVIPDKNLVLFEINASAIKAHGIQDNSVANQWLRNLGTSYMIQDYRNFFTKFHGKAAKETVEKYTEAGSALKLGNGELKLEGPIVHANPSNVLKTQQQEVVDLPLPNIHTHPDPVPGSGISIKIITPSNEDYQNAPGPNDPYMNIMVRPDRMFLYKTNITFIINSDIFKNPPKDITSPDLMKPKSQTPKTKTSPSLPGK